MIKKEKKKEKKVNETLGNLVKCWNLLGSGKWKIIFCIVLTLFLSLITAITPLLSAQLILKVTSGLMEELVLLAFFVFAIEIFRNVLSYFYGKFFSKYSCETISTLQMEIAKETLRLETSEIDKNSSGVFIDRVNSDTRDIINIYLDLSDAIIEIITNIGIFVAIFIVNKIIFLYFVITTIIIFIVEKIRIKKYFEIDKKRRKFNEKNTGLVGELVRGIRDIKVLNISNSFLARTKSKIVEANNESLKMAKTRNIYNLLSGSLKDLFDFLLIVLSVLLVNNNLLQISSFVVIYMYRNRISSILIFFTRVFEYLKQFNVSATRVFEVIDSEKFKKEKFGEKVLKKAEGNFEFKNVSFSYDGETKVLNDMSFKIKANETVAFVGKSGVGKTTIFSLIDKLYDIDSGDIYIDNINIKELSKDSIRDNISIITQNPYIFNMTIKENLKLVKDDMTDEEMIKVCKVACLDSFINTLKDKYDTYVGEGGITLSGGQRQRLAIARALLKQTEIILFDEATSALDNETQASIQKAINNMRGEYTIMIIAHRLSTVIESDRILVVDDGKIIASGKHNDLINNNTIYKHLYENELK